MQRQLWGMVLTACLFSHHVQATAEKTELKLGFVKLTDMAPLAVALEQGYLTMKVWRYSLKPSPTGKSYKTE